MKKILLKYLNLFALSGLLLAFVGCSDDNDSVTPGRGGSAFHRYLFFSGSGE